MVALQHASKDVEKMVLGNKCDMNDRRQVSKERGEQVRNARLQLPAPPHPHPPTHKGFVIKVCGFCEACVSFVSALPVRVMHTCTYLHVRPMHMYMHYHLRSIHVCTHTEHFTSICSSQRILLLHIKTLKLKKKRGGGEGGKKKKT